MVFLFRTQRNPDFDSVFIRIFQQVLSAQGIRCLGVIRLQGLDLLPVVCDRQERGSLGRMVRFLNDKRCQNLSPQKDMWSTGISPNCHAKSHGFDREHRDSHCQHNDAQP